MRVRALILGAGLLCSFAWFYQAGGWNQNSRFDLIRAIVERGTLRIDAYHGNTGDKAKRGGHVYSDKAPGLALAAVPAVAAARVVTGDPTALSYVATVATAALPAALAAVLLFLVAVRLGAGQGGAVFAAAVFGLATPAWAYATLLFGHSLATFGLVAAFAAAVALGSRSTVAGSRRRDLLLGLALGVAAGWATVTEYPSAPPAAILAGLGLARAWPGGRGRLLPVAGGIAVGAAACLAALLAYNQAAFGSFLDVGYKHLEGFGGMKEGVMGVTYPKVSVLQEILVGRFRGLLYFAPILAAAPFGFALLLRRGPARAPAAVAVAIVVYYVLFNSAYKYWNGGWSYGPRHLSPALPFLCLGLAPLWSRGRAALRAPLAALALFSAAVTLVAVSTTAQSPEKIERPLSALHWPAFREGDLSLNHQSFLQLGADPARLRGRKLPHAAWNLGEKLGLRGHASLLPLAAIWAAAGVGFWRAGRLRQ